MGDADPQEVVTRIARRRILQYMEHVMGFGIQNATVITLRNVKVKQKEYLYNDYSYHVKTRVVKFMAYWFNFS